MKLRISITDHCNLRCSYCRPTVGFPEPLARPPASLDDLASIAAWLQTACGVTRVRLTGGEPLLRPGVREFVERLAAIPGIEEVALTTNGALLADRAVALKQAGLARVNVSLDTLDPARFQALTGGGDLSPTLAGIAAAKAADLLPLKLNAVLLGDSWLADVPRLLDYAAAGGAEMRFIELMKPDPRSPQLVGEFVSAPTVQRWLSQRAVMQPMYTPPGSTARLTSVLWSGRRVTVGWITPRSAPFCSTCDRLRLDARGRLFRCLMDGLSLPLLDMLRTEDPAVVRGRVDAFLAGKHFPHQMQTPTPMVAIGG